MKSIDRKVSVIRQRRNTIHKFIERYDASDDGIQWITVHGTHIPLKDGKAVGGPSKLVSAINGGENGSAKDKTVGRKSDMSLQSKAVDDAWKSGDQQAAADEYKKLLFGMKTGERIVSEGFYAEKIGKDKFDCHLNGTDYSRNTKGLVEDFQKDHKFWKKKGRLNETAPKYEKTQGLQLMSKSIDSAFKKGDSERVGKEYGKLLDGLKIGQGIRSGDTAIVKVGKDRFEVESGGSQFNANTSRIVENAKETCSSFHKNGYSEIGLPCIEKL